MISRWMFTDEKWWDIVGPAASKYCKGKNNMERKLQNQVINVFFFHFPLSRGACMIAGRSTQKQKGWSQEKGLLLLIILSIN